ncbi:transmembrane protein, putative [Medicago truncatula]|uniref:Transmembrane protein, putative n=1 Tax=Medicago truncatula TaxID=3880 RepID=A0A072V8G0_MEDTR|nr:transmembrane protein, putative [Medicago truncatula]
MTSREHFDHLIVESYSKILFNIIFVNFKFNGNISILVFYIRKLPKMKLVVGFISVGSEDLTEYNVIIRVCRQLLNFKSNYLVQYLGVKRTYWLISLLEWLKLSPCF